MPFPNTGFFWHDPEEMISCILIADELDGMLEAVYQPTEVEIGKLAEKYKLDWDILRHIIKTRDQNAYVLLIEVNKFREYCQEVENEDRNRDTNSS